MKVYLAGPMRGLPDWNRGAFEAAAQRWRDAGHHVLNPWELAQTMGYVPDCPGGSEPGTAEGAAHLRHVMLSDVACIMTCDGLALLPQWERSRGASVELALAQFLGLGVYCAVTCGELDLPRCPWMHLAVMRHEEALDTLRKVYRNDGGTRRSQCI